MSQLTRAVPDRARPYALALALGLLGLVILGWVGETPVDAMVYRMAAHAVLHDQPLYGVRLPSDHLGFTYPPFAALALVPLAAGSWALAHAWWILVNALGLAWLWDSCQRHSEMPRRWLLPCLAASVALEPVWENFDLGQINLLLVPPILADLLRPANARGRGLATGLVAGIKLTPVVYLGLLAVTGQWRALRNAVWAMAATAAVAAVFLPTASHEYWSHTVLHTDRFGHQAFDSNQSVMGALLRRFGLGAHVGLLWFVLSVLLGVLCLAVAAAWWRRGERLLALGVTALAGLFGAPVSWTHHWVWCIPVGVALPAALRRAGFSPRTSASMAVAWFACFVIGPHLWVPRRHDRELRWGTLQTVVGNAYLWFGLALLLLLAVAVRRVKPAVAPRSPPGAAEPTVRRDASAQPPRPPESRSPASQTSPTSSPAK